jgi:arsenite methyltransferase
MTDQKTCCGPDCCGGETESAGAPATIAAAEAQREKVREGYGQIARSGQWSSVQSQPAAANTGCCGGGRGIALPSDASIGRKPEATDTGGCCGPSTLTADQVATAVGYATADLEAIPEGANMGLSCGNPTALASLKPGEVVLDLGSGGGFDCFIAGPKVGASGRVIGVDMTPDMLGKARRNIEAYRKQSGLNNVEFRLGEIEHLPVEDGTVDVVISNCVVNLSPDKPQVWREIARVLRPGGRVAVSDLALLKPLPRAVAEDVEALVGCVSGASLVDDVRQMAREAGLVDVELVSKPQYIDSMTSWQDPLYQRITAALPAGSTMSEYVTSLDIAARKA